VPFFGVKLRQYFVRLVYEDLFINIKYSIMKRILVAEDNRLILETVAHSLSREGYDIVKASDGMDCMAKLECNNVDLLITDLYMPNLNGLEVISKMNGNNKNLIPIMVLSAAGAEENVLKAFEIGADDFMVKPFSLIELNIRVRKLLELKK
jgi:DNA-binding response OmpR family regulator